MGISALLTATDVTVHPRSMALTALSKRAVSKHIKEKVGNIGWGGCEAPFTPNAIPLK
jgi:hypothetical protein